MSANKPATGDVGSYPYLWLWQAEREETEGRSRPTVLAAVVPSAMTRTMTRLYLLPITGTQPATGRDTLEIAATETAGRSAATQAALDHLR